ncbi:N-acylmannosamine kinase/N-acetylmannosamine-6-phosphate 2-epimerase / N-acetylmannosamine kinase [Faunimonas pinastri]|uniref:N-acylmannosamine kinase/N-acetylmannosamine-6-phosphate 2-epimerase / N-acetylmannosamine kinase n=1 Tax=Faunimonas pinastri TaxID=1855383 RepID=A0A1H9F939_9HYPH|nr:ROK family protein [Faunimonas pinastri]SEQ34355.1 N-acylmannosamine kinase/N-acetylmannosamine-6-phosphate 2-epimerase / N-acetylmannosamine kinase [Faunimonas pinastri]
MNGGPVLAIDVGGTKTLVALVKGRRILDQRRAATPREAGADAWLDLIGDLAAEWRGSFGAAGAAVTGIVRDGRWHALNPATLPVPDGLPLVAGLSDRLGVPVQAVNDAQAAAWGEYRFGAGQGIDMIFLTVSTGIGGGVISNGRLLSGRSGLAGHVGQMLVETGKGDAARLEDFASGSALARFAATAGHPADAPTIFAAGRAGEDWARELLEAALTRMAHTLRSLQMLFDPARFVIGGGVGLAEGYIDGLRSMLGDLPALTRPEIRPAALGAEAGLLGIADLVSTAQSA